MSADTVISLNLATTRQQWGFAEAVEGCLRHGISAISPWRDQIATIGLAEAVRIVRDNKLRVTGVCRGGMFPTQSAENRQQAIDDNLHAIDEAAALNADCLVLVVGGLPGSSKDIVGARQMVADGIAAILPHAKASGVQLTPDTLAAVEEALGDTPVKAPTLAPLARPGVTHRETA